MKLLDWMHRKFRQTNSDEHKELSIRQPPMDDLHYLPHPRDCRRSLARGQRESQLRRSFAGLETAIAEDKHLEEEPADQNSELFHGFLAIGTFGTDSPTNVPSTPTFFISADAIAEKKTEATEDELKLINDELEKVLAAESNDDGWNFSSGRNSHVSTGRSSHGSTITLSGKPRESADSNRSGTFLPLQEYLLGSVTDFPETTVAKKDHRVSLGELFQKTKEENSGVNYDKGEKRQDKSPVKLMKKMLKGKVPHPASRNSAANPGGTDIDATASSDKMKQKILQMFHRKVHPERSTACHKSYKTTSDSKKTSNKVIRPSNGDIIMFPDGSFLEENTMNFKSQHCPPQCSLADLNNSKKECWINTDAEYLVLEF
ncbi:hypothetical protein Leryth_024959 [Lithospermum erythrorhizon]|nr:hypothetical protein Leryth_024959 [Lithospermum erythrorhizon]